MTPDELRALADKKEEERIRKIGFLRCDLYTTDNHFDSRYFDDDWIFTSDVKDQYIKEFEAGFELALPKGTKFVCYIEDGEESWFDDINYGAENLDKAWADKYLEKVEEL